jgi:20S proteasome subunit alpha 4
MDLYNQVEYAMEAVKKGSAVVGVRGGDCVVIGVERKAVAQLQNPRLIKKVFLLDDHITLAFAGLTADARMLVREARIEAQSYRLTCEDPITIEQMARHIARTQQKYTSRGGVRPLGISNMIAGFSPEGVPQLFLTDPAGTFSSWKANCVGGKNEKAVRENLEKNWTAGLTKDECVRMSIKALLEVVDSGAKNMEIVVLRNLEKNEIVSDDIVQSIIDEIEREQEAAKKAQAESQDS